jgi:hypothetical protein
MLFAFNGDFHLPYASFQAVKRVSHAALSKKIKSLTVLPSKNSLLKMLPHLWRKINYATNKK